MTSPSLPETRQPTEAVPLLLGVGRAARFLGLSQRQFYYLQTDPNSGLPPKVALPGGEPRYYRRSDLEAWVASLRPLSGAREKVTL